MIIGKVVGHELKRKTRAAKRTLIAGAVLFGMGFVFGVHRELLRERIRKAIRRK